MPTLQVARAWVSLAFLAATSAIEDFIFPSPEELNVTETNFTSGFNVWSPQYAYENTDESKTYFLLIAEDCLPQDEGGGRLDQIPLGWWETCEEIGVDCLCRPSIWESKWNLENQLASRDFYGSYWPCAWEIRHALDRHKRGIIKLAGIASRCNMRHPEVFDEAREIGVPIILMGMNPPRPGQAEYGLSEPDAFIGNDEHFYGESMAKLLKQLLPQGGTYAFVMIWEGDTNQRNRLGFNEEMIPRIRDDEASVWSEIDRYPYEKPYNTSLPCHHMNCQMDGLVQNATVDAIIFLFESPIRNPLFKQWVKANRNLTLLSTGSNELALDLLNSGHLNGVLGAAYYQFGVTAVEALHDIATKLSRGDKVLPLENNYFETHMLAHNNIPVDLDTTHPPQLQDNVLGNLVYVGYVGYGIVVLSALGCYLWAFLYRSEVVVRTTQPFFLNILTTGILIFVSTVIPLSYDDGGDPDSVGELFEVGVCMSQPWLAFTGFTVIFSALFSKTWRVNRLLNTNHSRTEVSLRHVLGPFAVIFTCNVTVLVCWTIVDPLTYMRLVGDATDLWNREVESYGACRSDNASAFLIPLGLINVALLAIACWQAFKARHIESAFSESNYIALCVGSLFQAFLTGFPILVIVKSEPRAFYIVLTLMILVLSEGILILIFLPKMYTAYKYSKLPLTEQKKRVSEQIKSSNSWAPRKSVTANAFSSGHNGSQAPIVKISEEILQDAEDQIRVSEQRNSEGPTKSVAALSACSNEHNESQAPTVKMPEEILQEDTEDQIRVSEQRSSEGPTKSVAALRAFSNERNESQAPTVKMPEEILHEDTEDEVVKC